MSEVVGLHHDLPIVEQIMTPPETPKLGELALLGGIGEHEAIMSAHLNPNFCLPARPGTQNSWVPVVTHSLLAREVDKCAVDDRQLRKQATHTITQLFYAIYSTGKSLADTERRSHIQRYCIDIGPVFQTQFAFDARKFDEMAHDKQLLDSLYRVGQLGRHFLAHYAQQLRIES